MLEWIGEKPESTQRQSSIHLCGILLLAATRIETLAGIVELSAHRRQPIASVAALVERRASNSARP